MTLFRHRFLLASIITGLLLIGVLSAWYVIKRPTVYVKNMTIRADSEYVLFNCGMVLAVRDCYEYLPEIKDKYDDIYADTAHYTNNLTSDDLGKLKNLPDLKHLSINQNSITDLTEIGKLTQLEGLYCGAGDRYDKPKDFTPLRNLTNLKYFSGLALYDLNDLTVFENTNDLLLFQLTGAYIQNGLDVICSKRNLTVLALGGCKSDDFSPIGNCKNLKALFLYDTNVDDLNFLKNLINLEKIDIQGTNAVNYSVLLEMPSLTHIKAYEDTIPEDIYEKLIKKGIHIDLYTKSGVLI